MLKRPKAKKINWDKNNGWSKHEQVGYNQAIHDYEAYLKQEKSFASNILNTKPKEG